MLQAVAMITLQISIVIGLLCVVVTSFNVDLKTLRRYTGPVGSKFGFSVAQHKEKGLSWIIVGAPEAEAELEDSRIGKGGIVYKCDPFRNDDCSVLIFDPNDRVNNYGKPIEDRSGQWLGATVRSSGEEGVVLACAPRYAWYGRFGDANKTIEPVGTCYVSAENFTRLTEFSPCRSRSSHAGGYHKQGYCQVGLGADISKDSERLYIGAVGSWFWQGKLIMQGLKYQSEVKGTREDSNKEDDSYMGYSVASLTFYGTETPGAAVGKPRGRGGDSSTQYLVGKVLLFTWNLTNVKNLTGEQLGSYFGYSVCVADIDGDGAKDVIVGAPFYTEKGNRNEYETGRVYIFYQGAIACKDIDSKCWASTFTKWSVLDGAYSKSRFGLAVASLGDINKDGYEDFAVAAPYEETWLTPRLYCEDEAPYTGAVYIYHGSKYGVKKQYTQVIRAIDVSQFIGRGRPLKTFGFSLAGGLDLDGNQYPDLTVGAYESAVTFAFRTRPVCRVSANLTFAGSKIISLEEATRESVQFEVCLQYTGINVDETIELDLKITLDALKPNASRLVDDSGLGFILQRIPLTRGGILCKRYWPYLKTEITDKLTPIVAEVSYALVESRYSELGQVLEIDDSLIRNDTLIIKKNCGPNNICIPDLVLDCYPNMERFTIGMGETLILIATVENRGQDSFETVLHVTMPPTVSYINVDLYNREAEDMRVNCYSDVRSQMDFRAIENNNVYCELGNPLPANKILKFGIKLQPLEKVKHIPKYEFYVHVNSTNAETKETLRDNFRSFSLPIWEDTSLNVEGESFPKDVHYEYITYSAEYNITRDIEAGPLLDHRYTIKNLGPSDVSQAEVYIYWPSYTASGENLLYLLYEPDFEGDVFCAPVLDVNPEYLKIERKKTDHSEHKVTETNATSSSITSESSSNFTQVTVEKNTSTTFESSSSSYVHSGGSQYVVSSSGQYGSGSVSQGQYESSGSQHVSGSSGSQYISGSQYVSGSSGSQYTSESSGQYESGSASQGHYGSSESQHVSGSSESQYTSGSSGSQYISGSSSAGSGSQHIPGGTHYVSETHHMSGSGISGGHSQYASETSSSQHVSESSGSQYISGSAGSQYISGGGSSGTQYVVTPGTHYVSGSGTSGMHYTSGPQYGYSEVQTSGAHVSGSSYESSSSSYASGSSSVLESASHSSDSKYSGSGYISSGNRPNVVDIGGSKSSVYDKSYYEKQGQYSGGSDHIDSSTAHVYVTSDPELAQRFSTAIASKTGSDYGVVYTGQKGSVATYDIPVRHSVHESEREYKSNTTWGSGPPKTYIESRWWKESDNGHVTNGSYSTVSKGLVPSVSYQPIIDKNKFYSIHGYPPSTESDSDIYELGGVKVKANPASKTYYSRNQSKVYTYGTELHNPQGSMGHENVDFKRGTKPVTSVEEDEYKDDDEDMDEEDDDEDFEDEEIKSGKSGVKNKRQTDYKEEVEDEEKLKKENCGAMKCTLIRCTVNQLYKNREAIITIRSLVWVRTVQKIAYNRELRVSSKAVVKITEFPHIGRTNVVLDQPSQIFTNITSYDMDSIPNVIPLWIVVLSSMIGALILMLLVYLLYRCGFFKRNRPSTVPERQLLRDGQYHYGDEHL